MTTNIDFPVKFYVRESSIQDRHQWVDQFQKAVLDPAITSNGLRLYLFLVSRDNEGGVALDDAQKGLGLSDEDFKAAYLTLAAQGYLMRVIDNPTKAFEYPGVTYFTQDPFPRTDNEQANLEASEGATK